MGYREVEGGQKRKKAGQKWRHNGESGRKGHRWGRSRRAEELLGSKKPGGSVHEINQVRWHLNWNTQRFGKIGVTSRR